MKKTFLLAISLICICSASCPAQGQDKAVRLAGLNTGYGKVLGANAAYEFNLGPGIYAGGGMEAFFFINILCRPYAEFRWASKEDGGSPFISADAGYVITSYPDVNLRVGYRFSKPGRGHSWWLSAGTGYWKTMGVCFPIRLEFSF